MTRDLSPEDAAKVDLAKIAVQAQEDHLWIVSQRVRNKARAIILTILALAMAGIYVLQNRQNAYLQERRTIGEQRQEQTNARLSADEYAACDSLRRGGQTNLPSWGILNCELVLEGPVPSGAPTAPGIPSPAVPSVSAQPSPTSITP